MKKKKILVHGTPDSLQKFFADQISRDFDIIAVLSDDPEKISLVQDGKALPAIKPQDLNLFVLDLVDGIIFTNLSGKKDIVKFFIKQVSEPRKIIFWDAEQGWGNFSVPLANGTQIIYFYGLEFHIRDANDIEFFKQTNLMIQNKFLMKNLTPELYPTLLEQDFQRRMGKPLDFNNLKTFTEKMQWIKIFDATPLKSRLADKYLVRYWIEEKIGAEYLIPLLGVWDDFDDINFDELPNQFVLKCNHGSGMNIICRDKEKFNKRHARERINAWLAFDYSALCLEPHYTRINRKIIAEKFMANGDAKDLTDYKFSCFNGRVNHCKVMTGRTTDERIDYFDMNWQPMNIERLEHPRSDNPEKIPKPKNFELMKELASKLAEGFAFVRVDFYELEGKVYFGEMTFTSAAGNQRYKTEGIDELFGDMLKLPIASAPPNCNFAA
ncbi:MAG: hypothetical protein IJS69_01320 [Selenomonadaceae bacterium]|nr:hypothetical protein [Selenomonadaceae bacterium]